MRYREFGKTGMRVSEISLGTWQVGGKWGSGFDDARADRILNQAVDAGINFIDTADVYEGGKSEAAVGRLVRSRSERVYIATKCGRYLDPHTAQQYTPAALRGFVDDSLRNTGLDRLDLIQLHCPPTDVYRRDEIFGLFDDLQREGKIAHLGVSVEKIAEAEMALQYPNVQSVQIIINMFRQRPVEEFLPIAVQKNCGVIVRVPLASGLLTGKFSRDTRFAPDDHRNFNRNGEAFDKGETFSGVDYETGIAAAEALKAGLPGTHPLSAWALKWLLMQEGVSTVIPGASSPEQLQANVAAASLPDLTPDQLALVRQVYERYIKPEVHGLW
ncbi:aldo/keto reductase [Spirochaeta africana]|uniref:Putative oxidoreductase, aryl-alcohol dehydrogenase like protein n=1 Tax=Spirochaeta africana (strain ATCC 700263 / DSM 8902 / Z-7692) TaxID=889378 RepID=H9UIW1_SPIAZ|nr:aldo/keto reductase [Spirochaeta africana]AFG37454.1 putative oxidoreductase, aryl-alcohol dehydrogenase like protein [Spirochaeta africana DSM 8902]